MLKPILTGVALLLALNAYAKDSKDANAAGAGDVKISHPWARATVPSAKSAAAFLTLASAKGDRLTGVATPLADKAEIHEMQVEGTVMRMRAVGAVDLPAGKPVKLAPGGYHIMLTGLKRQLKEGERFPLTLTFARGGSVEVSVQVDALTAKPASDAHAGHH